MKLTEAKKKRLAALLAKAADKLTADEHVELAGLKAMATEEKLDFTSEDFIKTYGTAEAPNEVTADELTDLVAKAVAKALEGKAFDPAAVTEAVKSALPTDNASLKAADVEGIVQKCVNDSKLDKDALLAEFKKLLPTPAAEKPVTKAELDAAIEGFKSSQREGSKHQFAHFGGAFPVEHRSGNLSIAQKQLLNICLGGISEDALSRGGSKRPASINEGIKDSDLIAAKKAGESAIKSFRTKALTTGGAGSGAELVPTDLSSDLQMRMYMQSQLAAMLLSQEIDMPSDPFKLPLKTTRTTFYTGAENPGSDPTASNPGTGAITLDTVKLIGIAEYSYEADEDSIVAILPMLQDDLASGAAFSFENAVLNGDTTSTHQDSDIHAVANHHAKAFKGLRKLALAGSSTKSLATGGISAANIGAMRKQMGKYGTMPKDLILVVGPNGYNDIIMLSETLTFDKVGNPDAARILSGTAASIFGIPIIVSDACREDLNASGVYDGTTTTKGGIYLAHRPSLLVGVKRGFTVEIEVDKKQQLNSVIASFRRDFKPKETIAAAMPLCVFGYNFTA